MNEKWNESLVDELSFWDDWLRTQGREWPEDYKKRFDKDKPFSEYHSRFLPNNVSDTYALDVGAGPITHLGYRLHGGNVNITAIDPLAYEYSLLFKKYNVTPPIVTESCKAEEIAENFPRDYFDIVTANNSLDHCENPMKAILGMIEVCKHGGWVLLNHAENEGENEKYQGLHYWNFKNASGEFIITSKDNHYINVASKVKRVADIYVDNIPNHVQIRMQKL